MLSIIAGSAIIIIVMCDLIGTTLTTKGEGRLSALVSGAFRKIANTMIKAGHVPSEVLGATSLLFLGTVWLAGLWAGWVLVFLGLPEPLAHAGSQVGIDLTDIIYFVGFTLSTLGVGDITPDSPTSRILTTLASFNGLLIITLIVTYALAVVSGVVSRRALAYKIYLAGGEEGEFLTKFSDVGGFTAWVGEIKKELIQCTEQRLAYPVLDNFISRDQRFALAVQLARLGLASQRENQNDGVNQPSKRELDELLSVLDRYTTLAGYTDKDLATSLGKLGNREGWPVNIR